jgi:hypothetical protein
MAYIHILKQTTGQVWWYKLIIPATQNVEIGRINNSPDKKLARPPSQQTSWALRYTPVIPPKQEAEIQGLLSEARDLMGKK